MSRHLIGLAWGVVLGTGCTLLLLGLLSLVHR